MQELRIYRVDGGLSHPSQPLAANADADATQDGGLVLAKKHDILSATTTPPWSQGPVHAYTEK